MTQKQADKRKQNGVSPNNHPDPEVLPEQRKPTGGHLQLPTSIG